MSTLKVNKIENTATTDGGIEIDNTGHVQIDGVQLPTTGALSNRNKIFNGDMRIDQRNAGSAVTANSAAKYFPVDRFWGFGGTTGVYTLEQVEDAPAGFRHSIKGEVTTVDSSINASSIYVLEYRVEGYDMQDLEWGTSDAKTVTLSFYVKVSQAGTYSGAVHNSAQNRSYGFTWSVSGTDWERITITIPGETTGTWEQTTATGMSIVLFALGVGSTYESANSTQWEARSTFAVSGNTYLIGTLNSTFNITGVQLEVGDKATPFEHRSFGDELIKCQRYFQKVRATYESSLNTTGSIISPTVSFVTPMRATPTIIASDQDAGSNSSLTGTVKYGSGAGGFYAFSMQLNISSSGFFHRYLEGTAETEL